MNFFTILFIAFRRVIFDGIDDDEEYDETDNLVNNNDDYNYEDSDVESSNFVDYSLQSKIV
jgi:hypothetical protein